MFTIADVEDVHDRLGTAATLPEYLRELNAMGVARSHSFLSDGHSEYVSEDGHRVAGPATHEPLVVAEAASPDQARDLLERHSRGESSYFEMSKGACRKRDSEVDLRHRADDDLLLRRGGPRGLRGRDPLMRTRADPDREWQPRAPQTQACKMDGGRRQRPCDRI